MIDINNGCWLLPTRRRIPLLQRFFDHAAMMGISTRGFVLVETKEFGELMVDYYNVKLPKGWEYVATTAEGMGDKLRQIWPSIYDMDWIGWIVDDVIWETPEFDKLMIGALNGKNMVTANDGVRAPFRHVAPVFSGDLLRRVGYLYAPGFWHAYMDDAWEAIGTACDCWDVAMDVKLTHTDAFQTGIADETHAMSYSHNEQDKAAFDHWRRHDMDAVVKRVLGIA